MSNPSFKDRLIEAAKEKQQADRASKPQLSKTAGCIFLSVFLVLFVIIGLFIGKQFFMEHKGFDLGSLGYASEAQIELMESVLQNGAEITRDHCIIVRAKKRYEQDFGESYLLGTRLKSNNEDGKVLTCLLIGPKNNPTGIRSGAYVTYPELNCESCWDEINKDNYHHYKTLRGSGSKDLLRYFSNNFDNPAQKTRGLLWSIYGLGKRAEVEK